MLFVRAISSDRRTPRKGCGLDRKIRKLESTSSAHLKCEGNANDNSAHDWLADGESSVPYGSVRNRVLDKRWSAAAVNCDNGHLDGAVDDSLRYSRDFTGVGAGDPRAAEGRCAVHQFGIRSRRARRDGPGGQGISYSA